MNLLKITFAYGSLLITRFRKLSIVKKTAIVIVFLIILYFGATKIFGQNSRVPQYQTAQVTKGTLITTVGASGTVSSGNSASITTTIGGVVNDVFVHVGDTVVAGQNIATITLDQASQQKQASAWSNYLNAQNTLNAAKAKMNSLQSALFVANQAFVTDRGVINPSVDQKADPKYIEENANWLQAEADYNNQASVIAAAQASLASAWYSYAQTSSTITAPISGIVTSLTITPGLPIVTASSNVNNSASNTSSATTLGTITLEGGQPQASINLTEIDAPKVKVGDRVTLTLDAFPGKTFTGKVATIDTNGSVSSGVTTYPATIVFDSAPDNLYPNMNVSAKIITQVKDNVLLVPSVAVQTTSGQTTVRVVKNGQLQSVPVEIGDANDTQTEIITGLSEGDTVVTSFVQQTTGSRATSSPFGGSGFGGIRGAGGGGAVLFRRGG